MKSPRPTHHKLHWALDVSFGEDLDRRRAGHAAQNFSNLNRIPINLPRQDKTGRLGVKGKWLKAGWDNEYPLRLLRIEDASATARTRFFAHAAGVAIYDIV